MALSFLLPEDVQSMTDIMRGLASAVALASDNGNSPHDASYRRGFAAGLFCVAEALGLPTAEIMPKGGQVGRGVEVRR